MFYGVTPSIRQRLATIRILFDWLIVGPVLATTQRMRYSSIRTAKLRLVEIEPPGQHERRSWQ